MNDNYKLSWFDKRTLSLSKGDYLLTAFTINKIMTWLFNKKTTILICIFFGSFFLLSFSIEDSFAQMARRTSPKRHLLYGSIELTYEQKWTEDNPAFKEFGQRYKLGIKSFIIDPRLININASAILADSTTNFGDDSSLKGINLNINLLETTPRKWRGVRRFIPGPITLRYSNFSSSYDLTHYGVSLIYSLPQISKKASDKGAKKNGKQNGGISLPTLYFDYDNNDYETKDNKYTTDSYSMRAVLNKKNSSHTLQYEHFDQEGTVNYGRETLMLRSNYRFFDEETRKKTDIALYLKMENIDDRDQIFFNGDLKWRKPFDKDTLYLQAGVDYSRSSWLEDTKEGYTASASGSYTKIFSPRTVNTTSLSLAYGEKDDSAIHSELLSNNIRVDLSRLFRSTSDVFIGNTEKGVEGGLTAFLATKTRVSVSSGYSFNALSHEDEERLSHKFTVSASGPLRYNMNFSTSASYTMRDVTDSLGPYTENILGGYTNLFWRLPKTVISFNGNYSQTIKNNDEERLLSLSNRISRFITRRTLFNVYTSWTRVESNELNKDRATFEVRPILRWRYRELSLDAEYNYRDTETETSSLIEHRFLLRVVRRFSKLL